MKPLFKRYGRAERLQQIRSVVGDELVQRGKLAVAGVALVNRTAAVRRRIDLNRLQRQKKHTYVTMIHRYRTERETCAYQNEWLPVGVENRRFERKRAWFGERETHEIRADLLCF